MRLAPCEHPQRDFPIRVVDMHKKCTMPLVYLKAKLAPARKNQKITKKKS